MSVPLNQLIDQAIPAELEASTLVSFRDAIVSRRQKSIPTREQSDFGHQTDSGVVSTGTLANSMSFYISDNSAYLDTMNSYITCRFKAKATTTADADLTARFLDVGGIQSCIREIRLECGGTVIDRVRDASKIHNIIALATQTPSLADMVLGGEGDSMEDYYDKGVSYNKELTTTLASVEYDHAGHAQGEQLLALGVAGKATVELAVGDIIRIETAVLNHTARVLTIVSDVYITVEGLPATDIAPTAVLSVKVLKADVVYSTRKTVVNTLADNAYHKLCFKVNSEFLRQAKYFPLPFLDAPLQLTLEFNDARNALVLLHGAVSTNKFGYVINQPKFVAMLVEPDRAIFEEHRALYNQMGLVFKYQRYAHYEGSVNSGESSAVVSFQASNIQSARSVFSVLTSSARANSTGTTSQDHKCQSSFLRDNLASYRFNAGGNSYPNYGVVECDDIMASQAWQMLQLSVDRHGNNLHATRIKPQDWMSVTGDKFIMSAPLDQEDGLFSGEDLSKNVLELELQWTSGSTASEKMSIHTFILYDTVLRLSKERRIEIFS